MFISMTQNEIEYILFLSWCETDEHLQYSKESQQIQDREVCSELEWGGVGSLWMDSCDWLSQLIEGSDARVLLYKWYLLMVYIFTHVPFKMDLRL